MKHLVMLKDANALPRAWGLADTPLAAKMIALQELDRYRKGSNYSPEQEPFDQDSIAWDEQPTTTFTPEMWGEE